MGFRLSQNEVVEVYQLCDSLFSSTIGYIHLAISSATFRHNLRIIIIHYKNVRVISTLPGLAQLHLFSDL